MDEEMSDPWAEFEKKYARGAVADTQGSGDPWADLEAKYARQKPEAPQQPEQPAKPANASDWRGTRAGGVARGLRDVMDGGAQFLTRGLESASN